MTSLSPSVGDKVAELVLLAVALPDGRSLYFSIRGGKSGKSFRVFLRVRGSYRGSDFNRPGCGKLVIQ